MLRRKETLQALRISLKTNHKPFFEQFSKLNIDFNIKTFKCNIHSTDIRNSIDGRPYITQNIYNLIL